MELLVQAKIEPGNVGVVQLAPTYQATASNADRAHGGSHPPYFELFGTGGAGVVHESLQSEQGTRFLGKRNRNTLRIAGRPVAESSAHRWLGVDDVLALLGTDHLVNTDARSVLICSPWEELAGRAPFSGHRSGFGADLSGSVSAGSAVEGLEEALDAVRGLRSSTADPEIVPLESLPDWRFTDQGLEPSAGGPFVVRQIAVEARGREVPTWDQPIVDSRGEGSILLVCGRTEGILHFLLRPRAEAGLPHRAELGPSWVSEPGSREAPAPPFDCSSGVTRADCRQSEEGGRFFRDVNRYRIVDVGQAFAAPSGWFWLTLAQIRILLDQGGWLTNEARSALSLLLRWL